MSEESKTPTFDQWAVVEMLGHRRVIGRVTEQVIAGFGFLRIDVPGPDDSIQQTQFVSPSSIYAMTPVSEEAARLAVSQYTAEPISVWELPQSVQNAVRGTDYQDSEVPY